nr:hypothetical protein [Tanacetum cinerariifolium]
PPAVVLCTAHAAHALDAYDLGVVDYLLKPVRFERFVKTINRLQGPVATPPAGAAPELPASPAADSVFLKTDAGTERAGRRPTYVETLEALAALLATATLSIIVADLLALLALLGLAKAVAEAEAEGLLVGTILAAFVEKLGVGRRA